MCNFWILFQPPTPPPWKAAEGCPMPLAPVLEGSRGDQGSSGDQGGGQHSCPGERTVAGQGCRWPDRFKSWELGEEPDVEGERGTNPERSLTSGLATSGG